MNDCIINIIHDQKLKEFQASIRLTNLINDEINKKSERFGCKYEQRD